MHLFKHDDVADWLTKPTPKQSDLLALTSFQAFSESTNGQKFWREDQSLQSFTVVKSKARFPQPFVSWLKPNN